MPSTCLTESTQQFRVGKSGDFDGSGGLSPRMEGSGGSGGLVVFSLGRQFLVVSRLVYSSKEEVMLPHLWAKFHEKLVRRK
jgi:hypothetical protein